MKTLLLLLVSVLAVACSPVIVDLNKNERARLQVELDKQYFKECMELAGNLPQYSNGDSEATMVKECDNRAYWNAKREALAKLPPTYVDKD